MKTQSKNKIKIIGVQAVKQALKQIGKTPRQSRSIVNKALRPAGQMAVRAAIQKFKQGSKHKTPGARYNPSTGGIKRGKSMAQTIGIITAKRSREPGIFIGPRLKQINKTFVKGKFSRNLAAFSLDGSEGIRYHKSGKSVGVMPKQPDYLGQVVDQKGTAISTRAEKDLLKLLGKIIKKAGL